MVQNQGDPRERRGREMTGKSVFKRVFTKKTIFGVVGIAFFVWPFFVGKPLPSLGKHNATPTAPQPVAVKEEVPEMADILSSDQATRLKAGRRLVERVDVEKALEILEHSSLPHTGEGHLVVHQVGFYAYQKYGVDSILKCKDYFLFACYHGAIIEAATNQGIDVIAKMTDRCKASSARHFQCVHAAGHAILAIYDYNLPKALKTCDKLYEKEKEFPEALSSCHNGAFMENLFGVHDWGKDRTPKRDWLSDDPYFPCTAFGKKYQKGCWLNQAARIYQMNKGDIVKTAQLCEQTGNRQYTEWCFDNLARQLHPLTAGDTNKVFSLCATLGSYWREGCIIVNAGSYYSVGDRQAAITICNQIAPTAQSACFQNVLGQLGADLIPGEEKKALCDKVQGNFRGMCLGRIT